jgi:hypothetical protein
VWFLNEIDGGMTVKLGNTSRRTAIFSHRLGCLAVGLVVLAWIAGICGMTAPASAMGPTKNTQTPTPPRPPQPVAAPTPHARTAIPRDFHQAFLYQHPQGWVGIGLSCNDCSLESDEKGTVWGFESAPRIQYVDPGSPADRAGVQSGDVLVEIDGMPITSRGAGRRFGTVQPGEKVRWTYERAGKKHQAVLTVEEHPDADVDIHPQIAAEIELALEKLQEEQERLREADGGLQKEEAQRMFEMAVKEMEQARDALERDYARAWPKTPPAVMHLPAVPAPPAPPLPPAPPHNLRYEGTIAGSQVEVRGSGAVVVTEDDEDEIVITTPDATIRIRKKKI